MSEIDAETIEVVLEDLGLLLDIVVPDTRIGDWQKFIDYIRTSSLPYEYFNGERKSALPDKVDAVLAKVPEMTHLLSIRISGLDANCHFFDEEEIELDVDPRQMGGPGLHTVVGFMAQLGKLLGKDVQLSGEGTHNRPLITYQHRSQQLEMSWRNPDS